VPGEVAVEVDPVRVAPRPAREAVRIGPLDQPQVHPADALHAAQRRGHAQAAGLVTVDRPDNQRLAAAARVAESQRDDRATLDRAAEEDRAGGRRARRAAGRRQCRHERRGDSRAENGDNEESAASHAAESAAKAGKHRVP